MQGKQENNNSSYGEIRKGESAVMTWGKKEQGSDVRFVFTGDYFYLYTQKEYGDIKFYAQLNVDTEHDTVGELIDKYSYGTKGKEGISVIRTPVDIVATIKGLRSSSNGRNRRNADAKGQGRADGGNDNLDIRQPSNRRRGNGLVWNDAQKRGDNQGTLEYETGKEQKKGKEDEKREGGRNASGETAGDGGGSAVNREKFLKKSSRKC